MRGGPVRLACLGALLGLLLSAPAQAQERIINGHPVPQGKYPAQGFLEFSTADQDFVCGGSLVSNRYFLTAGHCATDESTAAPLDKSGFQVTLGKVDKGTFEPSDTYSVSDNQVESRFGYTGDDPHNDAALLTLSAPAPARLEPLRLIEPGETASWAANRSATVIGWGVTESGNLSDQLLEATMPMTSDADCGSAWGARFQVSSMVCAGGGDTDTCGGDSGGPLMVSDGAFPVLAGLTSWGADPCAAPGVPGVYTRLGATAVNQWIRQRVPLARATVSSASPEPNQTVSFTGTTSGPVTYTDLTWNFGDGTPAVHGANPSHAYAAAGNYVARLTASTTGDDVAVAKVLVNVASPPPPPPPVVTPAPIVSAPRPTGPSARILASGRPLVRHGRFRIRVNFTADAPTGTAIVELFRGKKRIATAKTRVRRNGSKRVTVKLSKAGRKALRRSKSKRLNVTVRVRVKRQVLQTRRLTIRR
jgi:trypsin